MVDVLLNTDDVWVTGGPETINLNLDLGATGLRGSKIFVSNGNPNIVGNLSGSFLVNDFAINGSTADPATYLSMYEYVIVNGAATWQKRFRLFPNIFSQNYTANFTAGSTTINVTMSTDLFLSSGTLTASNFNVQHSIVNSNPMASSIQIGTLSISGGNYVLPVTINAAKYTSPSTWANLTGSNTVQLSVSLV
jgi:hypothetical protein